MSKGFWTSPRVRQANAEADERIALREARDRLRAQLQSALAERDALLAGVAQREAEVERLRQKFEGQVAAFNSRHEEIESVRKDNERLRKLLEIERVKQRKVKAAFAHIKSECESEWQNFLKYLGDAAGREEGGDEHRHCDKLGATCGNDA